MYACAELFRVFTNVRNKFVFRRFSLRGGSIPLRPPLRAPLGTEDVPVNRVHVFIKTSRVHHNKKG